MGGVLTFALGCLVGVAALGMCEAGSRWRAVGKAPLVGVETEGRAPG
jgi:hypothetical protein